MNPQQCLYVTSTLHRVIALLRVVGDTPYAFRPSGFILLGDPGHRQQAKAALAHSCPVFTWYARHVI